jgi:8-oxo-dGTP pyrophosphatase MutT (NUDIX family)
MSVVKPLIDPSLVQLCTEDGSLLPQKMTISEANKKGLWHLGIHVVVVNKQNKSILVQKRSPRMFTHPSLLEVSLGGALKYGETFEEAALRETKEETGISASASSLLYVSDYRYNQAFPRLGIHSRVIAKNFILFINTEPPFRPEDQESSSAFFVSYKDAEELMQNGLHPTHGSLSPDHIYYQKLLLDLQSHL